MKKRNLFLALLLLVSPLSHAQQTITLKIDGRQVEGDMTPIWAWFGYDEPNYTYMKDGRKLLTEIAELSPVPVHVRAHNLMNSGHNTTALKWGSTNMYTEDENGNPVYHWDVVDRIFDTYVDRGMRPLAQLSFMPQALSPHPDPYEHAWQPGVPYDEIYKGWIYPPTDHDKWAELVYQWVSHCVDRYGEEEVLSWYWELWNEPDGSYFGGTVDDYNKLYDYSVSAIRRALPGAKVGGPHVTGPAGRRGGDFLKAFLTHCVSGTNYVTGKTGSPIDFIAFHAKGQPRVVEDHVVMNMGSQLRDIDAGCQIVASYPTLKHLPIIIGESDPEGCAACGMHTNPENAYRNGTMYSSYTAASFARKYQIADYHNVNLLGAVSWSFEFENQPWFYGFRDLATNGVDKPVLNVFRMFGKMDGKRLRVEGNTAYDFHSITAESVRGENDVNALAALSGNSLAVMVWNYHDADLIGSPATVEIDLSHIPAQQAVLHHYRIDDRHSNSYEVWKAMGSPQEPTKEQIRTLEAAGQLKELAPATPVRFDNGTNRQTFELPRQGVSLLLFSW